MVQDISRHQEVIEQSLFWAERYGKDAFPKEVFKNYKRRLRRIEDALSENCSAAAYGESQVGKSYLMSSLLSSPDSPFVIYNKGRAYSFIDELNSSGGENTKKETTGVITRFTLRQSNPKMQDYIKVTNMSIVDIILLLTDSYYNDVKISPDNVLLHDTINQQLSQMSDIWSDKKFQQYFITEDDIRDIFDYVKDVIGTSAVNICKSDFCKVVAPVVKHIHTDNWVQIFGLLWNNNPQLNRLFNALVMEYAKLNFKTDVYVPFEAVLRENGTLLNIEWLDSVCGLHRDFGKYIEYTDVYDENGSLLAQDFKKAFLSALIAEVTFVVPENVAKERKFLNKLDLLDFPGARSREKLKESELSEVLPIILRRGKVAYLFNKYSRSLKISAVLFCHHNDMKTEPSIGSTINYWIEDNIGETPEKRAQMLNKTNGIAPLFMICTKFNIDLQRAKLDNPENRDKLDAHWARFNTTIPEIIKPEKWFDEWVPKGGTFSSKYFQNIYLLRDFYYSAKGQVFDGFDGHSNALEEAVHVYPDYPEYFNDLYDSFCSNQFVKRHFANPHQAWQDVATVNNDGSKAIIRNLDSIADVLDSARREKYLSELQEIKKEVSNRLSVYYESDDKEENNKKVRRIIGDIKLNTEFAFGERPELFGQIIDRLMISSAPLREIAYDILVRHVDTPKSVNSIKFIRAFCNVDINDSRESNIEKLLGRYNMDQAELEDFLKEKGLTIDDVVSDNSELLSTVPDVIAKHIIQYWNDHINEQVSKLSDVLPHSDDVAFMLTSLLNKLGVKRDISDRINRYYTLFDADNLPNAIADYASLTLNNFVSTAGRHYMTEADLEIVAQKADTCHLNIDTSSDESTSRVSRQPLLDVLKALDRSRGTINDKVIDLDTLRRLPFWDNYQRWENYIAIGLLYSSDISHVDPVANAQVKSIIDVCDTLYNN